MIGYTLLVPLFIFCSSRRLVQAYAKDVGLYASYGL